MMKRRSGTILAIAGIAAVGLLAGRCAPSAPKGSKKTGTVSDAATAAMKVYVAPGDLDEYYLFASGGHSGQIYVYGLPSGRHISTIPVFTPYPATGYGFDDDSKKMLGDLTWGDAHHPALSETGGDYDGRWLFINDMNGRIARIDLRDFKTKQIIGPVPNVSGNHGSSFVTPNTDYAVMSSRFSIPIPKGTVAGIDKYATEYKGVLVGVKIDPKSGDFYEVAKQKLEAIIKPETHRLKELAAERAQAIAKYIVQKGGIPNERIFILDTALNPKRDNADIVSFLSLKTN